MFRNTLPFSVPITKTLSLCTATQATSVFSLESAEHMESKADTRLLMSSSLRAKVEFQRSDPQPLVGMSQCFPSKAMVTSFAQLYPGLLGSRPVGRFSLHLQGIRG